MKTETLMKIYPLVKQREISGRLTTYEEVLHLLKGVKTGVEKIGKSEKNRDIFSFTIGNGEKKVLVWSQMHGNEPTGTSAIFDMINFFTSENEEIKALSNELLSHYTLKFIPMLNPDGAMLWQRCNAFGVDLNRDAVALSAKESKILREQRDAFVPHLCFNLHDQRNIFNVSGTEKTATLSFLSPSVDEKRTVTPTRVEAMKVIVAIYKAVNLLLNGYMARFSDEFYPNATGDVFQQDRFPTVLIESGAYKNDDERQVARMGNFISIISSLYSFMNKNEPFSIDEYNAISLNDNKLCDILYKNVKFSSCVCDVAVLYEEIPNENRTEMNKISRIYKVGNLSEYFGIKTINANGRNVDIFGKTLPVIDEIICIK
ncbi:MAG: M14 family zinc carboxypeptidase [Flavobacteriales bacterium]|nr:M14 family zinc carboxypeptidase [Flavobacteriales bacterium]